MDVGWSRSVAWTGPTRGRTDRGRRELADRLGRAGGGPRKGDRQGREPRVLLQPRPGDLGRGLPAGDDRPRRRMGRGPPRCRPAEARRAASWSVGSASAPASGGRRRPPTRRPAGRRRRCRRQRVEPFGRIGVALTVIGFLLSVGGVVLRGLAAGRRAVGQHVRVHHQRDGARRRRSTWCWSGGPGMRWLGLPVTLLAAVGNGLAVTVFYVAVAPLVPALHSVWFVIHIVAAAIAGAAFNIGGLLSILFLIKQRAERRGTVARLPRAGCPTLAPARPAARTGSSPSPSRCGRSPSPPARSGPSTPGAATGAGTRRRPGPWSPG